MTFSLIQRHIIAIFFLNIVLYLKILFQSVLYRSYRLLYLSVLRFGKVSLILSYHFVQFRFVSNYSGSRNYISRLLYVNAVKFYNRIQDFEGNLVLYPWLDQIARKRIIVK